MAKQIENRVVEMEFNNKDFEKAVAVTLSSIDELNEKLDGLNNINTKGFDDISKAANKVDFSGLYNNIDSIADHFTVIGKVADRFREKLADVLTAPFTMTINALEKSVNKVFGIIVERGKLRSENLEKAKFQLEGIGVAWKDVLPSINAAVDGTAYGLDEAAKAASQFAASGVKLGDDMTKALRGISGVAAMTSSSYDEIADVFTSVSGKGRMMAIELNRLSAKGLNAAAALAKYLGVSESEITELTRKGQISFQDFAFAMDDAFGEHATAANETFTGALSNTMSALGRIGERFATPLREELRQVLVKLIPVINDFKNSLDPVVNSVQKVASGLKGLAVDVLEKLHGPFDKENPIIPELFGVPFDTKTILISFLTEVGDLIEGIGDAVTDKGGGLSTLGNIFLDILWNIKGVLSSLKQGITDVFGTPAMGDVIAAINTIEKWTKKLRLSENALNNLSRIFRGLSATIDIIGKTAEAVWKVIVVPLLSSISPLFREVMNAGGDLADLIYEFDQNYHPFTPLFNAFNKIRNHISPVITMVKDAFDKLKDSISKLTGITDLESFFAKLEEIGNKLHIKDIFMGIADAIIWAFDNLKLFLDTLTGNDSFNEYVKSLVEQNRVLTWVSDTFTNIKNTISDIIHGNKTISEALGLDELKQKFEWLNPILDTFKEHYKSIFEAYEGPDGSQNLPFIKQFGEALKKSLLELDFEEIFGMVGAAFVMYVTKKRYEIEVLIGKSVQGIAESIQKLASGVANPLKDLAYETDTDKILKVALAIGILASSVLLLGKMTGKELDRGLYALQIIAIVLGAMTLLIGIVFRRISFINKEFNDVNKNVKTNTLTRGKLVNPIAAMVTRIGDQFSTGVQKSFETISVVAGVGHMLLMLGIALGILAGSVIALTKVSKGNEEQFDNAVKVVIVLTGLFGLLVIAILELSRDVMRFDDKGKLIPNNTFKHVAFMILSLGIAIGMIVSAMSVLAVVTAFTGTEALEGSLSAVLGTMLVIFAITALLSALMQHGVMDSKDLIAAGATMIMMAAAISIMMIPIAALTAIAHLDETSLYTAMAILSSVVKTMALLALTLGVAGYVMEGSEVGMIAGTGAMIMLAMALSVMMIPLAAITLLAHYDESALYTAMSIITGLSLITALIAMAFGVVGGATGGIGAVAMIAGAAAMLVMAAALSVMLIPIAGMMALSKQGSFEGVFGNLAKGLGLLAVAVIGAAALSPALLIIIAVLEGFASVLLTVGWAVKAAGQGVLYFVSGLALLMQLDLDNLGLKVAQAVTGFIEGIHNALTGGREQITNGFLALVAAGTTAITGSTGMIAEAVLKLLLDVITVIDSHAQVIGFHLGHALMDIVIYALAGLGTSLADFFGTIITGQKTNFAQDFIDAFLPESETGTLKQKVFSSTSGLLDGLGTNLGSDFSEEFAGEATDRLHSESGRIFEGFGSDVTSSDFLSIPKAADIASDTFSSEFSGNIQNVIPTELTSAIDSASLEAVSDPSKLTGVMQSGNIVSDQFISSISENTTSQENVEVWGSALSDAASQAVTEAKPEVETAANELPNTIKDTWDQTIGKPNDEKSLGSTYGGYVKSGFVNGVLSHHGGLGVVKSTAEFFLGTFIKEINKRGEFGSPSRLMMRYGKWTDEGFAIGLDNSNESQKAIKSFTSTLVSSFSDVKSLNKSDAFDDLSTTISSIADAASSDQSFQPTIAPVLDLSNVNTGMSALDNMFMANRTVQLAGEASYLNDAGRDLNLQIQNNNRNGTNESINALGAKLDRFGEAIMNRQIVLDSGELVGGLVNPMDRSLGVRAIKAQRA